MKTILELMQMIAVGGTHSVQYWGEEWDGTMRCQDGETHPAADSFFCIMPLELSSSKGITREEFNEAIVVESSATDALQEFQGSKKGDQLLILEVYQSILKGDWRPSGLESDRVLVAMGYVPHIAKLAANLYNWRLFA